MTLLEKTLADIKAHGATIPIYVGSDEGTEIWADLSVETRDFLAYMAEYLEGYDEEDIAEREIALAEVYAEEQCKEDYLAYEG